eukprot:gene18468-24959_t
MMAYPDPDTRKRRPGSLDFIPIEGNAQFVLKLLTVEEALKRPLAADPQLLLDYRCYLPDGHDKLGTNYPPQIQQCLKKIANMTVPEVQQHYGFVEDLVAYNLHARATDMLTKGFEWASKYGDPMNAAPKRYRVQPKCCEIKWEDRLYKCAHEWKPNFELPVGDMTNGRNWTKEHPDTGTYIGGTHLDD